MPWCHSYRHLPLLPSILRWFLSKPTLKSAHRAPELLLQVRPHTQIIGALVKLGCDIVRDLDGEEEITVCRGAVILFHIPRGDVSVFVQRVLLKKFNFTEDEFLSAIYGVN